MLSLLKLFYAFIKGIELCSKFKLDQYLIVSFIVYVDTKKYFKLLVPNSLPILTSRLETGMIYSL